ncbi:hypothetical protein CDAR_571281 [Caerostris darwini]|uniref:Uncharacterized protein n=1 Tax=Caerostris darwini TaxID=1538125 RepID=A0AAV4SM74_9ARAC|nr:hypothetical protein CDAR_571281 [Caerostris darwini]
MSLAAVARVIVHAPPAADVPVPFLSSRFKSRLMSLQSDLLAAATVAVSDACPSTWIHPSPAASLASVSHTVGGARGKNRSPPPLIDSYPHRTLYSIVSQATAAVFRNGTLRD